MRHLSYWDAVPDDPGHSPDQQGQLLPMNRENSYESLSVCAVQITQARRERWRETPAPRSRSPLDVDPFRSDSKRRAGRMRAVADTGARRVWFVRDEQLNRRRR